MTIVLLLMILLASGIFIYLFRRFSAKRWIWGCFGACLFRTACIWRLDVEH